MKKLTFYKGIKDGIPICLGYISVAFAFGIFSTESGLSFLQTVLISMTNVTSAGQLAAVPIIAFGGTLTELALAQFVINLRYALMSVSLSQKLDKTVGLLHRFIISFVNTDEVFAVASANKTLLNKSYLYGLIFTPYLGWCFGTTLGAGAGNILPQSIISALGIAIYGMFIAIVVPDAKSNRSTALCVMTAVILSCIFYYTPILSAIPSGFTIIICSLVASGIFAFVSPLNMVKNEDD